MSQRTVTESKLICSSSKMAGGLLLLLLLITFTSGDVESHLPNSPHLISPNTFYLNHHKMLHNFKIYSYSSHHQKPSFKDPTESAFYTTLLTTSFLTSNPDKADLFFIPYAPSSRLIRDIRSTYHYWNRTLGADHFYLHCPGLSYQSDRNLVELKKNAVQISCFPTTHGHFIPHKDITLPPLHHSTTKSPSLNYFDDKFKYCLMSYADGSVRMIGEALRVGCVPVVMVDSGVGQGQGQGQDLPMMGVVRWGEMAVFVAVEAGGLSDVEAMRRVLLKVESGGGYERMKKLGVAAARHFSWGEAELDDQYDAFHSVMYQLWIRRHTIRYARVDVFSS